jgi:hypothetical protein
LLLRSQQETTDPNSPPKDKKVPAPGALVCGSCLVSQGSASAPKFSACTRCGLVLHRINTKENGIAGITFVMGEL